MNLRKEGEGRAWPAYLPGGRVRTSTFALMVVFCLTWWLHATYAPAPPAPASQETQFVPPGFVPDPEYTWVPRTNVETRPRTTYSTTTTTTTETSPPETTSPTETTSGTETSAPVPTTVVDPDGPGPLPPTTISGAATTTATTSPVLPVPNRSGTSTTTTTTVLPDAGAVPTTPPPPR